VKTNQLNDFTLTLFSSNVTCLKRLVLNVIYLSRLQCHILNQHPYLNELEIIFKDPTCNRTNNSTNELFYQQICPSINSKFDDIYTIYGPLMLHHLHCQSQTHQKLLNTILNSLHPLTFKRLKVLNIAHYKFFAAHHLTAARKHSLVDMSPLTKW
jgi:hypothetical protein